MIIKIEDILKKKGKTLYWLAENSGITYATIYKLSKNKTSAIRFDILETICNVLECTPNDILILPPLTHD